MPPGPPDELPPLLPTPPPPRPVRPPRPGPPGWVWAAGAAVPAALAVFLLAALLMRSAGETADLSEAKRMAEAEAVEERRQAEEQMRRTRRLAADEVAAVKADLADERKGRADDAKKAAERDQQSRRFADETAAQAAKLSKELDEARRETAELQRRLDEVKKSRKGGEFPAAKDPPPTGPAAGKFYADFDSAKVTKTADGKRLKVTLAVRYDPDPPAEARELMPCVVNPHGVPEIVKDADLVVNHLYDAAGKPRAYELTLLLPPPADPAGLPGAVVQKLLAVRLCLRTPVIVHGVNRPRALVYEYALPAGPAGKE